MSTFFKKVSKDEKPEDDLFVSTDNKKEIEALSSQVINLAGIVEKLTKQNETLLAYNAALVEDTKSNKILNTAKSFGIDEAEATKLANDSSLSYEEKLEKCLNYAVNFKSNISNVLENGTKPVGNLSNDDLTDNKVFNNGNDAVKSVEKEFGISGKEAFNKAMLLYPEAFQKRDFGKGGK